MSYDPAAWVQLPDGMFVERVPGPPCPDHGTTDWVIVRYCLPQAGDEPPKLCTPVWCPDCFGRRKLPGNAEYAEIGRYNRATGEIYLYPESDGDP